jgi:hypothetical protein
MSIDMDHEILNAVKRQIPFLIGGTITGAIMTYYLGFPITVIVNSIVWYLISYITYRLVWKKKWLDRPKKTFKIFFNKNKIQQEKMRDRSILVETESIKKNRNGKGRRY